MPDSPVGDRMVARDGVKSFDSEINTQNPLLTSLSKFFHDVFLTKPGTCRDSASEQSTAGAATQRPQHSDESSQATQVEPQQPHEVGAHGPQQATPSTNRNFLHAIGIGAHNAISIGEQNSYAIGIGAEDNLSATGTRVSAPTAKTSTATAPNMMEHAEPQYNPGGLCVARYYSRDVSSNPVAHYTFSCDASNEPTVSFANTRTRTDDAHQGSRVGMMHGQFSGTHADDAQQARPGAMLYTGAPKASSHKLKKSRRAAPIYYSSDDDDDDCLEQRLKEEREATAAQDLAEMIEAYEDYWEHHCKEDHEAATDAYAPRRRRRGHRGRGSRGGGGKAAADKENEPPAQGTKSDGKPARASGERAKSEAVSTPKPSAASACCDGLTVISINGAISSLTCSELDNYFRQGFSGAGPLGKGFLIGNSTHLSFFSEQYCAAKASSYGDTTPLDEIALDLFKADTKPVSNNKHSVSGQSTEAAAGGEVLPGQTDGKLHARASETAHDPAFTRKTSKPTAPKVRTASSRTGPWRQ